MSRTFATPLRLDIAYPATALLASGGLHLAALALVFSVAAPTAVQMLALLIVAISAEHLLWPALRSGHPRRLRAATWHEGARWTLQFADGRRHEAQLLARVEQYGPVLRLRLRLEHGGVLPLLVYRGAVGGDALRRLKVRVRLWRGAAEPSAGAELP